MKIKAIVKQVYEFELEVDDSSKPCDIESKIEDHFQFFNDRGREGDLFSDTEYDYREMR